MKDLQKIIVALDYETSAPAMQMVETLGKAIEWYKIGPMLFTRSGMEIIRFLHEKEKKIFVDLKLHDTPQVVANTVAQLAEMGVEFTSLHCLGGKNMLLEAAKACRGSSLKLIGLTLLTSFDTQEAKSWGWSLTAEESVRRLSEVAMEARLSGILCSPHEIAAVRKSLWQGGAIITPGIRIPGREVYQDDQKRFASPAEAIKAGADYLVIGRPILQASDPVGVVESLFR
jgi:orotidine-5'-phosphate decarboxylase